MRPKVWTIIPGTGYSGGSIPPIDLFFFAMFHDEIPMFIYCLNHVTLWLFNIAMENGPFIDGLPIKKCDFPWLC